MTRRSDHEALTRQMIGRRVNLAAPEESLLLTKAIGPAPHGGGKRFDPDSEAYRVIARLVEGGCPTRSAGTPEPIGISIEPRKLLLAGEGRAIAPAGARPLQGRQRPRCHRAGGVFLVQRRCRGGR